MWERANGCEFYYVSARGCNTWSFGLLHFCRMEDSKQRQVYLVGAGIASLASAAYLIRDGKIPGKRKRKRLLET